MSKVVGIDLGTSRCCVAAHDEGQALVISRTGDASSTSSVVAFSERGVLVGEGAEAAAVDDPESSIASALRLMGRKYHSSEAEWLRACCPYAIVPGA